MSWGEYFRGFNSFLLDVLPGYNKFRAPSVILVIPTLLLCMMSVMTMQKIISEQNRLLLWERYKKGLILTAGLFVVLLMIYFSVDYSAASYEDQRTIAAPPQFQEYFRNFINALKDDRKSLFFSSLMRSFFLVAGAAFMVWLYVRKRLQPLVIFGMIGLVSFIDVMSIDVNTEQG